MDSPSLTCYKLIRVMRSGDTAIGCGAFGVPFVPAAGTYSYWRFS
jgi:hypothetical protein